MQITSLVGNYDISNKTVRYHGLLLSHQISVDIWHPYTYFNFYPRQGEFILGNGLHVSSGIFCNLLALHSEQ